MATAYSESVTEQTPLDVIRDEIIEVFERILSEVRTRRDELLEQVSEMKREFEAKKISVTDNLKGLEEMRAHLENIPVKQNLAMKKQQESLADIDSEIEKLRAELTQDSKFQFNCSINQLIEQVKHFGEVIDESCVITNYQSIYSKKLAVVQEITGHEDIKFSCSTKLHIDYDKQLLYVLNSKSTNDRYGISVFNANDFAFIDLFGQYGYYTVYCIATSKEFVYVGFGSEYQPYYKLIQYNYSDYSIVKTIDSNSSDATDIFISSENQVYVLSYNYSDEEYEFHIYDRAMNLKDKINLCYQWPENEYVISAKKRQELFYMIINKQLLVFTQEGKNIRSIFHEEGKPASE